MTPPGAPANTGEQQTILTGKHNRRRRPDPVRTIIVASAVSLALGAMGWAASTTAGSLKDLRTDIDKHEKDDAGKWGEMTAKVNYLVEGVKEMRETVKEQRAVVRETRAIVTQANQVLGEVKTKLPRNNR